MKIENFQINFAYDSYRYFIQFMSEKDKASFDEQAKKLGIKYSFLDNHKGIIISGEFQNVATFLIDLGEYFGQRDNGR